MELKQRNFRGAAGDAPSSVRSNFGDRRFAGRGWTASDEGEALSVFDEGDAPSVCDEVVSRPVVQPRRPQLDESKDGCRRRNAECPKQSRAGWRKPSGMPKRPMSSYNLYFQLERERLINGGEERAYTTADVERVAAAQKLKDLHPRAKRKHRKSHGKISFGELARVIAHNWKQLPASTKTAFVERAAIEKAAYNGAIEAWSMSRKVASSRSAVLKDAIAKFSYSEQDNGSNKTDRSPRSILFHPAKPSASYGYHGYDGGQYSTTALLNRGLVQGLVRDSALHQHSSIDDGSLDADLPRQHDDAAFVEEPDYSSSLGQYRHHDHDGIVVRPSGAGDPSPKISYGVDAATSTQANLHQRETTTGQQTGFYTRSRTNSFGSSSVSTIDNEISQAEFHIPAFEREYRVSQDVSEQEEFLSPRQHDSYSMEEETIYFRDACDSNPAVEYVRNSHTRMPAHVTFHSCIGSPPPSEAIVSHHVDGSTYTPHGHSSDGMDKRGGNVGHLLPQTDRPVRKPFTQQPSAAAIMEHHFDSSISQIVTPHHHLSHAHQISNVGAGNGRQYWHQRSHFMPPPIQNTDYQRVAMYNSDLHSERGRPVTSGSVGGHHSPDLSQNNYQPNHSNSISEHHNLQYFAANMNIELSHFHEPTGHDRAADSSAWIG